MIQGSGDSKIVIKNLGPNELVEIPLPEEGGVTVLRGRNDRGKSEALKAVSVLAGGKDKISVRRDAPEGTKGVVSGRGVTVVIHKNVRRSGTAEFEVLDSDLSIEDIVDPGIKDPIAADAKRIKALLAVSGAMISPQAFYSVCGGAETFREAAGSQPDTDPLALASKIRSFLQKRALSEEREVSTLRGKADGIRQAYAGVDLKGETDAKILQDRLEKAVAANAAIQERIKTAERDSERYDEAIDELEQAKSEYDGKSMEEAAKAEKEASQCVQAMQIVLDGLRAQLKAAEDKIAEAKRVHAETVTQYNAVSAHDRTMKRLEAVVQRGVVVGPSDEEITAAFDEMAAARTALENGAKVRDAQRGLLQAKEIDEQVRELASKAEADRFNADQVSTVLNVAVSKLGVKLCVHNERLTVPQGDGSFKFFDELSMGARRKIALDIAIDSIGETGLIPLPQEAWEGWDFQAREEVVAHLKRCRVNLITAESDKADDGAGGNVRAEVYAT